VTERELPMTGDHGTSQIEASSSRLVGTLSVAGALAGLAIVLVFQWANPQIEEYRARVLEEAITEVLAGAERYVTVFLEADEGFTATPAADTADLDRVYVGFDANEQPVGIAVQGGEPGFQDVITLIFGYDPASGELLGMKVLEHKETPGLGDKIEKDTAFIGAFRRVSTPLLGIKKGRESGASEEIVMITGATISSRAIIDIINHRLDDLQRSMDAFWTSPTLAETGAIPVTADTVTADPGGGQ
jgi:H+/Na+-translocating ferredoxin:NAD+ oxidoreductase subunit G